MQVSRNYFLSILRTFRIMKNEYLFVKYFFFVWLNYFYDISKIGAMVNWVIAKLFLLIFEDFLNRIPNSSNYLSDDYQIELLKSSFDGNDIILERIYPSISNIYLSRDNYHVAKSNSTFIIDIKWNFPNWWMKD